MRTRTSPRNQEILWRSLGGVKTAPPKRSSISRTKSVYELLERDRGIPWDNLLATQQDDFLIGFWNRLRERGVLEHRITGARRNA